MTKQEVREKLNKIYKQRGNWIGAGGPFDKKSVKKRELILVQQILLYKIEVAKNLEDKKEEFFSQLYEIIDQYLLSL